MTARSTVMEATVREATAVVLLLALLAASCKKDEDETPSSADDDVSTVEDGSDTASAESDAQILTSTLISAVPGAIGLASVGLAGSELEAADVGDGARAIYFPRTCLTVAKDPETPTLTYTFDRCIGPNGLRNVTGEVRARYQAEGDRTLHLDLTATDLGINRATLDWTASAEITQSDPNRTMVWNARLSGTTARGRAFTRTNHQTITWSVGESCFALDGSSEGAIAEREIHTEISRFRRCRRACPDDGGTIVITNVTKQKRYELRYDGSSQATFIAPNGREVAFPLLCSQ